MIRQVDDDDEGIDVSAVPSIESLPSEDLATLLGRRRWTTICTSRRWRYVQVYVQVSVVSISQQSQPPTQTQESSTGDDPSADLVPSVE